MPVGGTRADTGGMTTHAPYLPVFTPELQRGDIVHAHGMHCLLDGDPILSKSHAGANTYYYPALVLNRADVSDAEVPHAFTWTGEEHRWTIQGNGLACWSVTRPLIGAPRGECEGHPEEPGVAGSRMGETHYCDGSCAG